MNLWTSGLDSLVEPVKYQLQLSQKLYLETPTAVT